MIFSLITVKNIDENRYFIFKYVIIPIYFEGLRNGNPIITFFTRKIYIYNKLKAKILFNINVIKSKKFELLLIKKSVYIGFYNVNI